MADTQRSTPDPDAQMVMALLIASDQPMTKDLLLSAARAYAALRSSREREARRRADRQTARRTATTTTRIGAAVTTTSDPTIKVRPQDQILARYREIASDDWLGFRREVLMEAMTLDSIRSAPGVQAVADADAGAFPMVPPDKLEQTAREYLAFAIDKILNHRGISASRSVEKLGEYAWLLARDDVLAAMDAAGYPQYGAAKVKAFADGMGWPWPGDGIDPRDAAGLARMVDGLPCEPDCTGGCGL